MYHIPIVKTFSWQYYWHLACQPWILPWGGGKLYYKGNNFKETKLVQGSCFQHPIIVNNKLPNLKSCANTWQYCNGYLAAVSECVCCLLALKGHDWLFPKPLSPRTRQSLPDIANSLLHPHFTGSICKHVQLYPYSDLYTHTHTHTIQTPAGKHYTWGSGCALSVQ